MRILAVAILWIVATLWIGCSDPVSEDSKKVKGPAVFPDSLHEGMLRIVPAGEMALLGSNDADARANEKPQMAVSLDYDYSLDIHEVTCGDFLRVLKEDGFEYLKTCESDSLPVVSVTYYDAVLYANARSKAEGLDTMYYYVDRNFLRGGNCISMEGLKFLATVNGYRLPTEAEWIYAASKEWNPASGWNSSNSDGELHKVCSSEPDERGFCDLAGNALEWTNDWLGQLKDTTVSNFIGSARANDLGEVVVKGGYYSTSAEGNKLYSRGDVYTVSAQSTTFYLGFRLAFGSIPGAFSMKGEGEGESFVYIESSVDRIKETMGTFRAKVAFRNDPTGNLAFLDYSQNIPQVIELIDTIQVYHPDISPDGSKVAFCTGLEGVGGKSSLYVRNLDAEGSGLVRLDVESAAIPRWYVDENQDTSIVYVDDVGDNSDEAEFLSRGTWKVGFANGKFGKPERLLDGAYHGGVSSSLAVSGSRLLRANVDGKQEFWYDGEQACNVSLTRAAENKVLFLDFGGAPGRKFAGEKYGTHQRILVADAKGTLIGAIPSPKGFSFDHSEWVNDGNHMVATLANSRGAHSEIVLVNPKDSCTVTLLSGEELWHPCFWVKPKFDYDGKELNLDSAGVYVDEAYEVGEKALSIKMRMFWNRKDSLELVALGSSRTERGLDPREISVPALNMGYVWGELWGELYLWKNYVLPHLSQLKYLILEISPDMLRNNKQLRDAMFLKSAPGYPYDASHDFWQKGIPEKFVDIVDYYCPYSREDSVQYVTTQGLLELESRGWGSAEFSRDSVYTKGEEKSRVAVLDSLTELIENTKDLGFYVIALIYPQSPSYSETGGYGRHGMPRSVAKETLAFLDSLAEVYPHFMLMDENNFGDHDYGDEMANDCDHMSAEGAKKLSRRLDSLIGTLSPLK